MFIVKGNRSTPQKNDLNQKLGIMTFKEEKQIEDSIIDNAQIILNEAKNKGFSVECQTTHPETIKEGAYEIAEHEAMKLIQGRTTLLTPDVESGESAFQLIERTITAYTNDKLNMKTLIVKLNIHYFRVPPK